MQAKEAAPMIDHRAAALAMADFSPFSMPPNRPSRSERNADERWGPTRIVDAIRRELDLATRPEPSQMPRIVNYPF
jgi:hypothetical protein